MKSIDEPSVQIRKQIIKLMVLSLIMMISCYVYHSYSTFKSIKVVVNNVATVEYGTANYDIKKLIKEVDGEIVSVKQDVDTSTLGAQEVILEITINAVDNSGNISTQKFTLEVVEPEIPQVPVQQVYGPVDANAFGGDLAAIAYSLVGRPYISGSNGPYGFDCSGFVQYVYSTIGINISRSTYTQLYDGVPVNYSDAQPGDIVIWGYGNVATHSSMYVGNGTMIHAANPGTGVIVSNIAGWLSGSGTQIIGVRRIK